MKAFFYGFSDTIGCPDNPGSLIVFAETREQADPIAANVYCHADDECRGGFQGECEVIQGKIILASSYYGVALEEWEPQ